MAGGMILLGIFVSKMAIAPAMVLHGASQLTSNASRAFLYRHAIPIRPIATYLLGAGIALLILFHITVALPKQWLYLGLGTMALLAVLIPKVVPLNFARTEHGLLCGFLNTFVQTLFGVSGPLLELFFVNSGMEKDAIMGTKGLIQTFGHAGKVAFWLSLEEVNLPLSWILGVIIAAILGSLFGKKINGILSERSFRIGYRAVLGVASVAFLTKGLAY